MKRMKDAFLSVLGVAALTLASITFYATNQAYAGGGGTKQYVSTVCPGGYVCNDCNSGTKTCSDNTCEECKPAEQ